MWAAHALTLSRLPIAVGLIFVYGRPAWAAALVALAALTDTFDGRVARRAQRRGRTRPDIGSWLDPVVDKIFVVIVGATLWHHTRDVLLVALIAARELVLVPLVLVYLLGGRSVRHLHAEAIGKAATVAQFAALGVALAFPRVALPFAAAAAALGLAAVGDYMARALRA